MRADKQGPSDPRVLLERTAHKDQEDYLAHQVQSVHLENKVKRELRVVMVKMVYQVRTDPQVCPVHPAHKG